MRGNDPNPFDEEEPEVNPFSVTAFLSMLFFYVFFNILIWCFP